jgi:protein subunit release factor B
MAGSHINPARWDVLRQFMARMDVREEDLTEKFILGGGSGGQKINKTSSCVYLRHAPTGIEIKCQRSRSRELNRYLARRELCLRIEENIRGEKSRRQQERERIRRQKRRRSRRAKERMLEVKHRQSDKKRMRSGVSLSTEL